MTVSEQKTDEWVTFPDAQHYQASHRGFIRSLPREKNGRTYSGTYPDPMKPREDGDGYLMFNYTDDAGVRHSNFSVARAVLLAHDPDGFFPGAEACHGDGGQKDNRFPENIRWDTGEANRKEALEKRLENNPPKVKPPKVCPRCQKEHHDKGRNCHACVVQIGQNAALYLAEGSPLDKVAEALDYSPVGVFTLAKRYGGMRCVIDAHQRAPIEIVPLEPVIMQRNSLSPWQWLRRVTSGRGPSRQNSDGA